MAVVLVSLSAMTMVAAEAKSPLFEYPSVPDKLTKPEMRANYMVEHLWDKCDLEKTQVTDLEAFHDAFTDYLSFFAIADKSVVEKSIKKYVERVVKNPANLNLTVGLLQSEVYNLSGQYCSDEVYGFFVSNIVAAKKAPKDLKDWLQRNANTLSGSAIGAQVADFPLRQSASNAASLYGLTSETTLLFFNVPDNIDCKIWKVRLNASLSAGELIKINNLKIVSVYSVDNAEMDNLLASEPEGWEVANLPDSADKFDQRLRPTIYLLDKDKKITAKFVGIDDLLTAFDAVAQSKAQQQ